MRSPVYKSILKYAIIEGLEFAEGHEENCFSINIQRICIKAVKPFFS